MTQKLSAHLQFMAKTVDNDVFYCHLYDNLHTQYWINFIWLEHRRSARVISTLGEQRFEDLVCQ